VKVPTDVVKTEAFSHGFDVKNGDTVRLNTSSCLVPQGNYGLCWAVAVATTVRYVNYPKNGNLTAKKVADAMGVGYNEGATNDTRQKALSHYGVLYPYCLKYQISCKNVNYNVLDEKPIIIGAKSSGGYHAVTIIGYAKYGSVNQIIFYNSGTDSVSSVEYKSNGTTFTYNNRKYTWCESLCSEL
jgi:hypothetical protein